MERQDLLTRGVAEIIVRADLEKKIASGKRLRIKFGIDPTSPDIHIGHAVSIRKMKQFQDLGHKIVFIIGDYTAQIGDPSGLDKTRQALTREQVKKNAHTYFNQAFKILDQKSTEIHLQSEWFNKFDLTKVIDLTSKVSVEQIFEHETFKKRLKEGKPFFVHEEMYPLLQGFDSVAIKADIEIGGEDQKFNLLMGRQIQKAYRMPEQDIILMRYLVGIDGKDKMSKSLGNYISIADSPDQMYGKVMSIPDSLIAHYFELATDITNAGLAIIKEELKNQSCNPKELKSRLAKLIVEEYYDSAAAEDAQREFEKIFSKKEFPSKIKSILMKSEKKYLLHELLVKVNLAISKSEASRLINQGGVSINGQIKKNWQEEIMIKDGMIIKVGKRKFLQIKAK